jgi:Kef-type K+ transport system membrane component KefB
MLVSLPLLVTAPLVFLLLLAGKVFSKIFGLYPIIGIFRKEHNEKWYYTLMMSTGLTFGSISALFGFSHGIITQAQYSFILTAVIASAVVPTLIAGYSFVPRHLLPEKGKVEKIVPQENDLSAEG